MKEEVKIGMMETWHTHQPGRKSRIGIEFPQLCPTLGWNQPPEEGSCLKSLAVELFLHLERWIQQEENPNPACVCCEGRGGICKEWKCISKCSLWREELARAELVTLFEDHSELEEGEWLLGLRVASVDRGKFRLSWLWWEDLGWVWFYFPLHKVILICWWCDGVLPELTALFLWEILCLAKCLGEGEAPWVPLWAGYTLSCPSKRQVPGSSVQYVHGCEHSQFWMSWQTPQQEVALWISFPWQ